MTDPDQLERELAGTRTALGTDLDRLGDRTSPASLLRRRSERIKASAGSVRDRLMGSSDSASGAVGDRVSAMVSSAGDATDSAKATVAGAAGDAPQRLREQAQGNPIAAGVIAFGVGWLLSSLVPATDLEQHAARRVEDGAAGAVEPLKQAAGEVAGNLQQPLQDAADSVKQAASDAADRTAEHARSATADVRDDARDTVGGALPDTATDRRS